MQATEELSTSVGISNACDAIGIPRASFYRNRPDNSGADKLCSPSLESPRALSAQERQMVLGELHSMRFVDQAPREIYATLLDEGTYHCSVRTMYRILDQEKELRERRNQRRHPQYKKPELLATGPNQVWSWDITKLRGPVKWSYFYLYVIIDIFSRYVVGWMVAGQENARLAEHLIEETYRKQDIVPGQLMLHSDRGSPMKAKTMTQFLADIGVSKSYSRPHVSDDNPFSESQFKTLKYRPDFPNRFGSVQDSRLFCHRFFDWYNCEHHHFAIVLLTPADVHYGRAEQIISNRQRVLDQSYEEHPERFVKGPPLHPVLPSEVWINPPQRKTTLEVAPGGLSSTLSDPKGPPVFNTYGDSSEVVSAAARGAARGSTAR